MGRVRQVGSDPPACRAGTLLAGRSGPGGGRRPGLDRQRRGRPPPRGSRTPAGTDPVSPVNRPLAPPGISRSRLICRGPGDALRPGFVRPSSRMTGSRASSSTQRRIASPTARTPLPDSSDSPAGGSGRRPPAPALYSLPCARARTSVLSPAGWHGQVDIHRREASANPGQVHSGRAMRTSATRPGTRHPARSWRSRASGFPHGAGSLRELLPAVGRPYTRRATTG